MSAQMQADTVGHEVSVTLGEDYPELREAVRRICQHYPTSYWRDLEKISGYPTDFVRLSQCAHTGGVWRLGSAPACGRCHP